MEVKKDILWRVYLSYLVMVGVCIAIFAKAVYIQQVEGSKWRSMSDSLHQRIDEVEAERGTIYSEEGQMLSTSIPQFDIFMDFRVEGLREKNGLRFRENIDSLSIGLANLFKDQTASQYRLQLQAAYRNKEGYYPLKKKISFREYQVLRQLPLFRMGRYKSGMIAQEKTIRLNPYQMLAFRTIGLARDANKVGLEMTYDALLKGRNGKQLVRSIAGGVGVPVDADSWLVEPETGKDIVSTLDIFIQEVAENALMNMMVKNEAVHGTAIVMEVKTGKIRAMANLGKRGEGLYWEDLNYAIAPSEPGSTFKLATLLALLEDKKVNLNSTLNLEGGVWKVAGNTVYDSERHAENIVNVKQAFELSSNVAMAKMATAHYSSNPQGFLKHLHRLRMDTVTGIDLSGERRPVIYRPGHPLYGPTTIPWMSFGYNLSISPLQTTMLYNAIANKGRMMKPYLVSRVQEEGMVIKTIDPVVVDSQVCSPATLQLLQQCLEGVCTNGTAKTLFKGTPYTVAGKTGTALVANGNKGYADKIYQSSFAGYFPANDPQYTCVVVIRNKAHAPVYYGASVAGPVFREIADRLYSTRLRGKPLTQTAAQLVDSARFETRGLRNDLRQIGKALRIPVESPAAGNSEWAQVNALGRNAQVSPIDIKEGTMPDCTTMGLKDALWLCEELGLQVRISGKGKVSSQSILPGQPIVKGQVITLQLTSPTFN